MSDTLINALKEIIAEWEGPGDTANSGVRMYRIAQHALAANTATAPSQPVEQAQIAKE